MGLDGMGAKSRPSISVNVWNSTRFDGFQIPSIRACRRNCVHNLWPTQRDKEERSDDGKRCLLLLLIPVVLQFYGLLNSPCTFLHLSPGVRRLSGPWSPGGVWAG